MHTRAASVVLQGGGRRYHQRDPLDATHPGSDATAECDADRQISLHRNHAMLKRL